jgi:hypothetical protein
MGADSVRLFDKGVSDHILGLSKPDLIRYLEERLDTLRRKETAGAWIHSLVLSELNQRGGSVAEAVEQLLAEKNPLAQLKEELVYDLAFGEEVILLDYWGCYVHVFSEGDPKGSLSSMKYLKDEEEAFLLLKPIHVDRMIRSLKEHINDLQVMDKTAIQRLEYMRDFCAGHPSHWVAYEFDF